jgi:hypothetical protein
VPAESIYVTKDDFYAAVEELKNIIGALAVQPQPPAPAKPIF